jgi:uncharacterized membrane protein (UPF0127 family)
MKRLLAAVAVLMLAQGAVAAEAPIHAVIETRERTIDLSLELAATEPEREQGLMNRSRLAPYDGMAFFFPNSRPRKFWMKNTIIPLDLLFVDEAGSIVYIVTGEPLSEKPVGPACPVATVIELNGGRASRDGIAVGDKVNYDVNSRPSAMAH